MDGDLVARGDGRVHIPTVYTGPLTDAQAQWMRAVAQQSAGSPPPMIIQMPQGHVPPTSIASRSVDWTTVIVFAFMALVLLAVFGLIAVACSSAPPPPQPIVHNENCYVFCGS